MIRSVEVEFDGKELRGKTQSGYISLGDGGFSPMDLVLVALGGCTGIDIISILSKMKVEFEMNITVRGKRREEHPRVYESIEIIYDFKCDDEYRKNVIRAVSLSLNKYCSVSAMLSKACPISYRIMINGEEVESGTKGPMEDKGKNS